MSKYYNEICHKIIKSNDDLYNSPNIILKEIDSIKKDINRLSLKLNQIHTLLTNLIDKDRYN